MGEETHALITVQNCDIEVEQLRHQRGLLLAQDDLQGAIDEQSAHKLFIQQVNEQRTKALIRQRRYENEATSLATDADTRHDLLYSGEMSSARDIQALQDEVNSMRSRQSELEDKSIEALIEADDLLDKIRELEIEGRSLDELVTVLETEQAVAVKAIDERLAVVLETRESVAVTVDTDLLATYENRRTRFGHSTVVSFDESKGCNCPSRMPVVEIARVRQCEAGSVLDCVECGRMLLR